MVENRRGTVSHLVMDVDSIKAAGYITAEQRAAVRLSRDDKRMIFYINKALEALQPQERQDIFAALNINPADLQPIQEKDFLKLIEDRVVAFTKYKYHHDRRLGNYFKIKEFMDQTQKRHGNGRCIYLSKEGSKLLLRKKNPGSKSIVKTQKNTIEASLQNHHTASVDRFSDDHSGLKQHAHTSVANSPNPYRSDASKFQKKHSMPQIGPLGAEMIINDKAMRNQHRQAKAAKVKSNKEFLSQNHEQRIHNILNKDQNRKQAKEEREKEEAF